MSDDINLIEVDTRPAVIQGNGTVYSSPFDMYNDDPMPLYEDNPTTIMQNGREINIEEHNKQVIKNMGRDTMPERIIKTPFLDKDVKPIGSTKEYTYKDGVHYSKR
jgi:hypothetical protein